MPRVSVDPEGLVARRAWVTDGDVVPAAAVAPAWGITLRRLALECKEGRAFRVIVARQAYCPAEFLVLGRDVVAEICAELSPLVPAEQLVFWKRRHGALGGRTVAEAVSQGRAVDVVGLAREWSAQCRASQP